MINVREYVFLEQKMLKVLSPLCMVLLLAGCGGGDSEPTPTPTPTPTIQTQSGSQLQASFDKQAGMLTLEWQDIATTELGYRVEQKVESVVAAVTSSWVVVEDLPAYDGQGQKVTWKKPMTSKGEYRVLVKLPDQNKVLLTAGSAESLMVSPDVQASIIFSQQEPVRGDVNLSVQVTGVTPVSVKYYNDLFAVGVAKISPNFMLAWLASRETDGVHQILAQIEVSPNNYVLIQRQVQIDNPNLSLRDITLNQTLNSLRVGTQATSSAGVKKLQLFIDNQPFTVITSPKRCEDPSCSPYEWNISLDQFGFGNHEIKIKAEDNSGEIAEKTTTFLKNAQPQLLLTQPIDGQIIGNTFQIAGSITDDEADPLLVISLRDLEIYRGVGKQFSTNFDMSSLPFGTYTLTFSITPKTGSIVTKTVQVNYQSLTTTVPEYVYGLGEGNYIQDVNQNNILFADGNTGNVFLYQSSTAQKKLVIEKSKVDYLQVKQVVGSRVLLLGQDIVSKQYQVYLWDNGTLKNVSEISGDNKLSGGYQEHPVMNGSWIVWSSGGSQRYHLYNVDTQENHIIAKPSDSPYIGNWNYSLAVLADTVRFYTWAQTGTFGENSHFDIFQYDTKSKETTRLTNNGLLNIYPQASKTRIAWQQTPNSQGNKAPYSLVVASVDNPLSQQILSTVMKRFWLVDNLLVWEDAIGSQTSININDGVSQYSLPVGNIYAMAGDGKVIYSKSNGTWVWQANKEPYQLFAFYINEPKFDDATGMLYFTTGTAHSLYRIKLP
jgi:hypothetical protein